ncbi:MAG TPA: alcohol dehydrogenase catalytic domain-containing protein [Gemmatimonadota bacterium]|nr:alcohol dehydrogenase catalytic domain-containing protein [Gemmatimonadota bacterium]
MKAVRILRAGGPDVLAVSEVEPPEPGPAEVAVDVRCAGVNRADVLQRIGRYPPPAGTRADIPGLEYAGVVSGVGEGVDPAVVGRRVMGLVPGAAYAERLVAPLDQTLPIPDDLDDVDRNLGKIVLQVS